MRISCLNKENEYIHMESYSLSLQYYPKQRSAYPRPEGCRKGASLGTSPPHPSGNRASKQRPSGAFWGNVFKAAPTEANLLGKVPSGSREKLLSRTNQQVLVTRNSPNYFRLQKLNLLESPGIKTWHLLAFFRWTHPPPSDSTFWVQNRF